MFKIPRKCQTSFKMLNKIQKTLKNSENSKKKLWTNLGRTKNSRNSKRCSEIQKMVEKYGQIEEEVQNQENAKKY